MRASLAASRDFTPSRSQLFWGRNEATVNRAVRNVARARRLNAADASDLLSEVWLKLLSTPLAINQFRGECSLATFVASIAKHVLLDLRVKQLGKWRPTAQSRSRGRAAVELDRLIRRDGLPKGEALEALRCRWGHSEVAGLESLNFKTQRRTLSVDPAFFEAVRSMFPATDHLVSDAEGRRASTQAIVALSHALASLSAQDRDLLERRYVRGETIALIAGGDFHRQKRLYRRLQAVLGALRVSIERAGVSADSVRGLPLGDLTNLECGCGFQNFPGSSV